MKKLLTNLVLFAVIQTAPAFALTITFNDTAPDGTATFWGTNGEYTESGVTFLATSSTSQFSLDPAYDPTNTPPDGTDFQTFEGGAADWTVYLDATGSALIDFQAAAIYGDAGGALTLTGHLSGGGTIVEVFNLPPYQGPPFGGAAIWDTYTLPAGWDNLTRVDFDYIGNYVGIDNVNVALGVPDTKLSVDGGYIKLDNIDGGTPPDSHCSVEAHNGRMIYDDISEVIWVCTKSGWKAATLVSPL